MHEEYQNCSNKKLDSQKNWKHNEQKLWLWHGGHGYCNKKMKNKTNYEGGPINRSNANSLTMERSVKVKCKGNK